MPAIPRIRGVWMLLMMLGAVLMLMRQMQQPSTVDFLGRVFAPAADSAPSQGPANEGVNEKPGQGQSDPAAARHWAGVKDNALFLPAEKPAWDELLARCSNYSPAAFAAETLGVATYAQLVSQPQVYRGRAVQVRGTILRESAKPAADNPLAIRRLHQLVIAPAGGGEWPIVVYCLELPEGFPRGGDLREAAAVDGYFFKNWSYPHASGSGVAPVIVANSVAWQRPGGQRLQTAAAPRSNYWMLGAALAAATAAAMVLWVVRQTRRPRPEELPPPDFSHVETAG